MSIFLKTICYAVICALPFTFKVTAQESVLLGVVSEKATGNMIPNVNVYLSGTSNGAATDSLGYYKFTTKLTGQFNLVASAIGYESVSQRVELFPGKKLDIDFEMEDMILSMEAVSVTVSNRVWENQVASFKKFFIGVDDFSDEVIIQNREVLDFDWNEEKEEYKVTLREPLRILNNALGYEVELEFENVIFNPENNSGYYLVFPKYKEIRPENKRESRKWKRNRNLAYEGSSWHFFKSLYQNRLKKDDFTVIPRRATIKHIRDREIIKRAYPLRWKYLVKNYKAYEIIDEFATVGHDLDAARYGGGWDQNELSQIKVLGRPGYLLINSMGNIYQPEKVQLYGKWSFDRFSKSLPFDYKN